MQNCLTLDVDGIVYSAQAGAQKPHLDFFDYAAKAINRQPSKLLFVDDTYETVEDAISRTAAMRTK